jgi:predicted nuclease of predicted toxin-antitoxin system
MRILADENVATDIVVALQMDGHDVVWASTAMPGSPDEQVLKFAIRDKRVLLTNDVAFATSAASREAAGMIGIILLRLGRASSATAAIRVVEALKTREKWIGMLAVIDYRTLRVRPL